MSTVEIPRAEWPSFFRQFSALHDGWRCRLEILSDALGAQLESQGLPLAGIDGDDGPDAAHRRITLALGDRADAHLTHVIDAAEHVWVKRDEQTEDEVIEIETAELRTLLHLRADRKSTQRSRTPR